MKEIEKIKISVLSKTGETYIIELDNSADILDISLSSNRSMNGVSEMKERMSKSDFNDFLKEISLDCTTK